MKSIIDFLRRHASDTPDKTALIDADGVTLSYAGLHDAVMAAAASLHGQRARVFRASPTVGFVIEYLACHAADVVAVPLERDIPPGEEARITAIVDAADMPAEVSDVLFTTGTTGTSKGTMISSRAILADAENLIDAQGFSPELTFIITGPLNHIGSLSKLWPCIVVGASVRLLDGLKDMKSFFCAVDQASAKVATFQVPASLRMIMRLGAKSLADRADKFDFIETGAAPMAQADMEALCRVLPNTRLYNTYASTETGIIATHDFNNDICVAGCLGRPMRHSGIVIESDGSISCYGDTLMTGYISDPEATAKVLSDGFAHTADRGSLDAEGRLRLEGRGGDVINAGGFKINPVEIEDAAMSHPEVADCICVPSPHPVLGVALRLIVVTRAGVPLDKKALATYLAARLERHKVPMLYTQAEKVNRTYNGKLDRKSYLK